MTRDELAHFMAEREVANYDVANDGRFGRKLSDFEPWEQKALVDAMRMTLEDLYTAGFAVVPKEPTPKMLRAGFLADTAEAPGDVYRAMIDAALKDEPK